MLGVVWPGAYRSHGRRGDDGPIESARGIDINDRQKITCLPGRIRGPSEHIVAAMGGRFHRCGGERPRPGRCSNAEEENRDCVSALAPTEVAGPSIIVPGPDGPTPAHIVSRETRQILSIARDEADPTTSPLAYSRISCTSQHTPDNVENRQDEASHDRRHLIHRVLVR